MTPPRLLIIEDEESIRIGLEDVFRHNGFEVIAEADGERGYERLLSERFDALILDIMLPTKDGFSICEDIRAAGHDLAIVMLTAKSDDADIINGLALGADDYVAKPFSVAELLARVQAVLRRTQAPLPDRSFPLGPWSIDPSEMKASNGCGAVVHFTRRELDVLLFLKSRYPQTVSRAQLLAEVWGYRRAARMETRTVDIHVAKLRRKLEIEPGCPALIVTVRSAGYRLADASHG